MILVNSHSSNSINHSTSIPAWPTELRSDWRQRTAFGKFLFLMWLPVYIATWAFIVLVIAVFVGVVGGGFLAYRGMKTVENGKLRVYRERE